MFKLSFSVVLLIFCSLSALSLDNKIPRDSLVTKKGNEISLLFRSGQYILADSLINELRVKGMKEDNNHALWQYYNSKGLCNYYQNNIEVAIVYFDSTLRMGEIFNDTAMILKSLHNRGAMNHVVGNYDKAIKDYIKTAKIAKINNNDILPDIYGNIGMMYQELEINLKAIEYCNKAIEIYLQNEDKDPSIIKPYNVLGIVYKNEMNYDKSKIFYLKALEIGLENEDRLSRDIADIYVNLSILSKHFKEDDNVIEYLKKAIYYYEKVGSKSNVVYSKINMVLYYVDKDIRKARSLMNEIQSEKENVILGDKTYYQYLLAKSKLFYKEKKYKDAYMILEEAHLLNDSINDEEQIDKVSKLEMRFGYEQQLKVDSLKQIEKEKRIHLKFEEEKALNEAQLSKQRLYSFVGIGGSLSLLIIALILFRNNKAKTKANKLISNQKIELEEKQTEILDSINYAQKIQNNILPPIDRFNKISSDFFLLFMPKDIVSGDFYWFEEEKDLVFFAVADCTGHGVPGAMVSMVCSNALSKVVKEEQMLTPGGILDRVKAIVSQQFKKSDGQGKDGMDISLCCWNPKTKILLWSGANNPLWLIKKGSDTITSITPDKQPIGHSDQTHSFTTHEFQIQEGDTIYLFSDGYHDQFGGAKEKKLKTKGFKNIIQEGHYKEMYIQKETLETKFNQWKGELEQLDDVCVMGIKF